MVLKLKILCSMAGAITLACYPQSVSGGWLQDQLTKIGHLTAPPAITKLKVRSGAPLPPPRPRFAGDRKRRGRGNTVSIAAIGSVLGNFGSGIGDTLAYTSRKIGVTNSIAALRGIGDAASLPVFSVQPRRSNTTIKKRNASDTLMSAPLAAAIRDARKKHYRFAKPLPRRVVSALSGVIPAATLKRARYVRGDLRISLPNVINGVQRFLGNSEHAVVVNDVIVFSIVPETDTPEGIEWWAHEVHHVYQYKVWGVDKFAAKYLKNSRYIERRATTIAKRARTRYNIIAAKRR